MTPGMWPIWTPGTWLAGLIGRIYVTLLHTKYIRYGPHDFSEEDSFKVFPIISLWEQMTPGAWPVLASGLDWQELCR